MIKNFNFSFDDGDHCRLKVLAARRGTTIGRTLAFLLDLHDEVEVPTRTDALYDAKRSISDLKTKIRNRKA